MKLACDNQVQKIFGVIKTRHTVQKPQQLRPEDRCKVAGQFRPNLGGSGGEPPGGDQAETGRPAGE